jgi:ABC-type Zn2+ transport system substrate-binding protein/surface adhesin
MPAMSDTATEKHGEAHADEHAADEHAAAGHAEHGHDEEPLGPPDVGLWAAGVGGVAVAIVIAACFAFSTGAL